MIICLKQTRIYQYCIEQCIPGDGVTQTPAVEAKVVDANVEACGLITNFLDSRTFAAIVTSEEVTQNSYLLWKKVNERFASSTFNSKARIWSKFQKLTFDSNLKDFITNTQKCLSDIASVGIAVEEEILAFSILTKLPEEFHSLIEKVTLNAETQGNPDAILNVLHEASLKEEALSTDTTRALILKKDNFPSKLVHYCSNSKHNPRVTTHGPEKCWQLHPELKPERRQKDKEQKANFTIARALFTHESRETNTSITIVLDTGASNHMFNNKSFFENHHTDHHTKVSTGCGKSSLTAQGKGLATIVDRLGNLWLLPNSLYVPDLTTNLLALSNIAKKETRIKRTTSFFEVYLDDNNRPSFICPVTSGILETQIKFSDSRCLNTQIKGSGDLWHKRLGHMNKHDMMKLVKTTKISDICDECIKGKITQLPFKQTFKVANHILENIHLDLCGPFQTPSIAGAKYFLIIIDQISGFISTKFLKNKSDCFNHFRNFKLSVENKFTTKIKNILTDGGGEFINKSFRNYCAESGINHIVSPPYTPQHNPFAERGNRSILEKSRCMLLQSQLPNKFWAEAVSTATFLCNLIPKHDDQRTPYEIWHNSKPPLHRLKPFGCKAWLKIPAHSIKNKFDSKAWDGIFLGYENEASSYHILRLLDQEIIISRQVIFDEKNFPSLLNQKQSLENIIEIFPNPTQTTEEEIQINSNTDENSSSIDENSIDNESDEIYVDALEQQPKRIRVIGPRHPTLISSEIDSNNILPFSRRHTRANLTKINQTPKTFDEAMTSPNKEKWDLAIKKELQNMENLNIWTLRNKKDSDHPITSTWVFKEKEDDSGKIIEHKARLCAHGFHQIAGLDYQSTFAPTGRLSSLRALISFAAIYKFNFHQMDVRSAFLNAPLQEEISLEIPQGISANKETQVLQLNKALYGLKQASLAWYKHLSKWLITSGFSCSITDPCVFWRTGKKPIWIYVHVDDLAIFGPNLEEFKKEIKNEFDMKDLGKANLLLGIKINHLDDGFSLDQEHYIKELADKYGIRDLIPSNTPLKPHLQLSNSSEKEHEEFNNLNINYRSAVGSLNYISSNTRPDITFAVSHLSQFLEKPGLQHWNACLQVFRYLFYSKNLCLTFKNHGFHHINTYADADWGNNPIDRRSISGFTVSINLHLISWRSKRQQTVSHSTTEAEYQSLSDAAKETTWLINLLNEIQITTSPLDPLLLNDNKGAIDLALNDANHSGFKTKHMDIKFHFILELLKKGTMLLKHVPTTAMNADFLTKAVGKKILFKSLNFHNLLKKTCALSPCSSQGGM
ncbi:hypothetical protein O181_050028 [Austropuccinia psidii MF-1]|uniref:Integrase catalytic domain-containing protein n=1 Tax=Austropuccinia psidii MF-1 TaxID=1389203 RepID=A0A9Q3E100_9BASI|nr:hypothetical protein [Austropuccinia psidii MF-1]